MKKLLTKIIAVILVLVMVTGMFAGCGTPKEPEVEKVTLKIANYAVLETGYIPFWEGVKKGFEAANENVTIEWVTAPYGEIQNTVINMAGAGTKVDAVFGEIGWTPAFEDSGLSCPIDEVLSKEFLADFPKAILDSHSINGKAYAVPLYVSPFVLYYNKDIFEKAGVEVPTTYDELLVVCEKISKLKDANGNKIYPFGQTTSSVPVSGSALTAMLMNFGGQILNEKGELSIDNQGFKDAVAMIDTLDEKGYNPQNQKLKDLRALFANGQLAMYYDQSWGFNGVKSINPDALRFAGSAKPLVGGQGKGASLLQSHCFMLVNNGEAQTKALAKFVEYVISAEVLTPYLKDVTPAYPARTSMGSIELSSVLAGAAGSQNNVIAQAFVPQLSNLNLDLCSLAQNVTMNKKDIETAIAEFKKSAEMTLKK